MGMMTQKKIELQEEVDRLTELLEEANNRNAELDKALNDCLRERFINN